MPQLQVLLLLLLAAPVLAQTTTLPNTLAQVPPAAAPHTLLVRATAERELEPSALDVLLTYRFSDNVRESERTQAQESNLREVLKKAGISEEKLVLEDLSASGYGGFSKVGNTNVTLTKVYRLTLDNPRQLGTLVPQLVQTGADNLRFVNLRNSQQTAARAEVAAQAVAEARQKALLAARAAGSQLGAALSVVEVLPYGSYSPDMVEAYGSLKGVKTGSGRGRDGAPVEIDTPSLRRIRLTATYDVLFELKP